MNYLIRRFFASLAQGLPGVLLYWIALSKARRTSAAAPAPSLSSSRAAGLAPARAASRRATSRYAAPNDATLS